MPVLVVGAVTPLTFFMTSSLPPLPYWLLCPPLPKLTLNVTPPMSVPQPDPAVRVCLSFSPGSRYPGLEGVAAVMVCCVLPHQAVIVKFCRASPMLFWTQTFIGTPDVMVSDSGR